MYKHLYELLAHSLMAKRYYTYNIGQMIATLIEFISLEFLRRLKYSLS